MSNLPNIVGRKVTCIHPQFPAAVFNVFDRIPQRGVVYTVKEVFWAIQHGTRETVVSIRLGEIPPLKPRGGGFSFWRFRLLHEFRPLRKRFRKSRRLISRSLPSIIPATHAP